MAQPVERAARDAKIAELKRLITAGEYETQEKLEDAVDAFLWSEQDRLQQRTVRDVRRNSPASSEIAGAIDGRSLQFRAGADRCPY